MRQGHESVDTVVQVVLKRTDAMDEAVQYLVTAMFNALHNLLEYRQLYSLKEGKKGDWPAVIKCSIKDGTLPLVL